MCGSTAGQTQVSDEQNNFYKQLTQQYGTVFGENQNILGALTKSFQPILAAGINQRGFSDAERTSLNTEAGEGTAQGFGQAQAATSEALAARGGGDAFTPSGADNQILANNANAAAASEASAKNTIVQNDYATGRANYGAAASALSGVAGQYNPTGLADATTSAGSAAGTTANQIATQSNSLWQGVIGAAGAIGGAATTGGLSLLKPHP